jgi:hypothetical protein
MKMPRNCFSNRRSWKYWPIWPLGLKTITENAHIKKLILTANRKKNTVIKTNIFISKKFINQLLKWHRGTKTSNVIWNRYYFSFLEHTQEPPEANPLN